MRLRLHHAVVPWLLVGLVACKSAPPLPMPVHDEALTSPPTSSSASPPLATVRSRWECTSQPLPDGTDMDRLLEIVKENRLFATANQKLAAPRVPGDAAGHAFAEARALLHAERWPEATMAFGEIALAYPHDALGIVAAMLYLEGLNMLGSVPDHPRPDCFQEMRDQLPALQQLYCENGENRRHPRECLVFFRIERSLGQRTGCGISEPSKEPPEVLYARVGAEYLALAIRCVEVTRLADVSPLDDQCDDFAFYAARAFLNVPNRTRAGLARAVLLDPKNGMLKSPRVQDLEKLWK